MDLQKTQSLDQPPQKRGYDVIDGLLDSSYDSDEEKKRKRQRKIKRLVEEKFYVVDQLEEFAKEQKEGKIRKIETKIEEDEDSEKLDLEEDNLAASKPKIVKIKKKKEKKRDTSSEEPDQKSLKNDAPPTFSTHTAIIDTKPSRSQESKSIQIQKMDEPLDNPPHPTKIPMPPPPAADKKKKNTGCCAIL